MADKNETFVMQDALEEYGAKDKERADKIASDAADALEAAKSDLFTAIDSAETEAKAYADNVTFAVSEDATAYVYTFTFTDAAGEVYTKEIDLPLESVVVSGRYDADKKEIILTLDNGTEVEIPVGDLVDGLATESDLDALTETVTQVQTAVTAAQSSADAAQATADNAVTAAATAQATADGKLDKDTADGLYDAFGAAATAEADANAYTDTAIASIPSVDLSDYYTKEDLTGTDVTDDEGDTTHVGGILDEYALKSDYYTKEELSGKDVTEDGVTTHEDGILDAYKLKSEFCTADEVVFSEDLTTTYEIGNITLTNGQATISAAGKSLAQVWDTIFVTEKNPTTTQPSLSISSSQMSTYEVGTGVTPSYTSTFSAGSYTYGPATGVTAESYTFTFNGETLTTSSGTFSSLVVGDSTSLSISGSVTHTAGAIPVTNLGNEYPAGQIQEGTKTATRGTLKGYRKTFYGTTTDKATITSATLRGLSSTSSASSNGSTLTVSIPVGAMRVIIAYPATLEDVSSIKDVNGMNAEISSSFTQSTLNVEGADGYEAISYKVYVLEYANAIETANTYSVTI